MVKTPHVRHSRPKSEPETLELEAVTEAETAVEDAAAADHATEADAATEPAADAAANAEAESTVHDAAGETAAARAEPLPAAPAKPKRGFFSLAFAGLLGGGLALGGNYAMERFGLPGQIGGPQPDIAGLLAAQDGKLADAQADIDALKSALASVKSASDTSSLTEQIKAIEARLAAAEQAKGGAAGDPAALAALETRLATLAAAAEAAQKSAANAESGLAGQGKRIDALDEAFRALKESAGSQAGNPAIARAIAAAALKSAIDRGLPFMAELETYAAVAPEGEEIAALRGMAASGVPTRADLAIELSQTAGAIIAAAKPSNPDAGLIQNLIDSAMGLVEVRPIGAVDGEGADAIVARMEAALKSGDLGKALAEFATLPDPSKAAGAQISGKIQARMQADALIDKALASALAAREG